MNKYNEKIKVFYSRSGDPDMKYLSNFEPSVINILGSEYPSVEHGFQAMKYVASGYYAFSKEFEVGNKFGLKLPKEIKKEGGKGGFKRRKVSLNISKWEKNKKFIMEILIDSRYSSDERFRDIVDNLSENILFHYESTRGKGVSYWGGSWVGSVKKSFRNKENFNGKNILGNIIMNAKKNHQKIQKKIQKKIKKK